VPLIELERAGQALNETTEVFAVMGDKLVQQLTILGD